MEDKVIHLNYIVLTICYIFATYYVIHGLLLRDVLFGFLKMPTGSEISIANILIVLGVNCLLVISVGCHAVPDKMFFLAWHTLSSIVLLAVLLVLGLGLALKFGTLDETIITNMQRSMQAYNFHSHQKALFDIIQKREKCCGIFSAEDWLPLSGVPRSCIIRGSEFDKNLSATQLKRNQSSKEAGVIDMTILPKESLGQFINSNGCYYSYRKTASNNFTIIIVVIVFNSILLGVTIVIETMLFIETARKEEARCLAAIAALQDVRRRAVRDGKDFSKLYKPAPTHYDESYADIQFTESEQDIIYPKTRLRRFLHRLFNRRKERLQRGSGRRVANQNEKYENSMIHWMYYF